MVRQSPSNLQAHPHRLARAASLTALAAALSIGLPAGAQAEEPAAAGPDTQTAVEQLTAEEPPLSSTLADSPVDDSDLPAGSGTPGGTPADAVSSTDEETPTPTESGATTETGSTTTADTPAAGAPVQTEEGAPEQDPQPALPNEASESDASNQAGTADQTADAETAAGAEAAGSADPSTGAGSAEAIATDAAVSPTPADAAVLEEGSSDEPADGQDGPSGTVELLAGDGFHYAFVTDGAECILWDYVTLEGVVEVPYVGPGVYLWVDADVASFTAPAQVDGQPVVSVAAESSALSALDLSAAAPTIASLYFHYVNLTSIDLSDCAALRSIHVFHAPLTVLDVSGCPLLEELNCSYSNVAELDVSNSPHLAFLFCMQTNLVRLDLSNNHELGIVLAQRSQIEEILLPTPSSMVGLTLDGNRLDADAVAAIEAWAASLEQTAVISTANQQVTEDPEEDPDDSDPVDLIQADGFEYAIMTGDEGLEYNDSFVLDEDNLGTYYTPGAYLWVDEETASFTVPAQIDGQPVIFVNCDGCGIESLDLSEAAPTLREISCADNNLVSIDVSACSELVSLDASNNPVTSIDVSGCPQLGWLHCEHTQITELDVSQNPALYSLFCGHSLLKRLDLSNNHELMGLACSSNQIEEILLPTPSAMGGLVINDNCLDAEAVAAIESWAEPIKDQLFLFSIGEQRVPEEPEEPEEPENPDDSDDDDIRLELIQGEGFRYAILTDSGDLVDDLDSFEAGDEIANYGGVGAYLWVDEGATSFTAPAQIDGWPVRSVDCSDCGLSSLDLSEAASTLTVLICENNNLTSLDLSACTELRRIVCGGNQLAALDISNSPELSTLHCVGGSLTEIDLSHNPRLTSLMLTDMPIKRVDISHNPEIMVFSCFDTQLEELVLPAVPCEMALMILYGNHLSADTMAEIQAWCDANRTAVVFGEQHAPENPDDPNEPSEPVDPSNPNDPDNPGAGENPDKPAGPTDPGQGGTTGEKPGRPSGQQGGSGQGGQTGAIPQTGDENATGSAAALGMLGGAAALAGAGTLALRRKAGRSR